MVRENSSTWTAGSNMLTGPYHESPRQLLDKARGSCFNNTWTSSSFPFSTYPSDGTSLSTCLQSPSCTVMDHDHGLVLCLLSTNQWDWRPISTQQYYGPRLQLRIGTGNTCRLRGRESGGWGQHRGHLRWISLGTEGTTFLDPVSGIHPVRNE